ncbi:MAG: type IV secretion system DNA-binding domain-containing protein, partial [Thermodesulfobium sp.]
MAIFTSLTRGGQVHLHQLRMLKQVLLTGFLFSILIGIGYFIYQSYMKIPPYAWQIAYEKNVADLILATLPPDKQKEATQNYVPLRGKTYRRNCLNILKDPYIKKTTTIVETLVEHYAYKSLWFSLWVFLFICGGWLLLGYSHRRSKLQRGATLASWRNLRRRLRWTFKASDLKLGKLPFVKGKETSHILITGTTGSGKTNAFNILLPQIRKRGN